MDNLIARIEEVLRVAEFCLSERIGLPALILIYSVIDIVAALERQGNKSTRNDFLRWVARYLVPGGDLPCTPKELYGARCGVIHTLSGESDFSRTGEARRVAYAYGVAPPDALHEALAEAGHDDVVIHVDTLLALVRARTGRYFSELKADRARAAVASRNARKCFTTITDTDIFGAPKV